VQQKREHYLYVVGSVSGQLWVSFGKRQLLLVFAQAGKGLNRVRGDTLKHLVVDLSVLCRDPTPSAVPELVANRITDV